MRSRQVVSLLLLAAFLISSVSGLVLYAISLFHQGAGGRQGPEARAAEELKAIKHAATAIHIWSSFAMLGFSAAHIWLNRKALARYVGLKREKAVRADVAI